MRFLAPLSRRSSCSGRFVAYPDITQFLGYFRIAGYPGVEQSFLYSLSRSLPGDLTTPFECLAIRTKTTTIQATAIPVRSARRACQFLRDVVQRKTTVRKRKNAAE